MTRSWLARRMSRRDADFFFFGTAMARRVGSSTGLGYVCQRSRYPGTNLDDVTKSWRFPQPGSQMRVKTPPSFDLRVPGLAEAAPASFLNCLAAKWIRYRAVSQRGRTALSTPTDGGQTEASSCRALTGPSKRNHEGRAVRDFSRGLVAGTLPTGNRKTTC